MRALRAGTLHLIVTPGSWTVLRYVNDVGAPPQGLQGHNALQHYRE